MYTQIFGYSNPILVGRVTAPRGVSTPYAPEPGENVLPYVAKGLCRSD